MGKLSVLGAQRVKALESMLDDKMKEELAKVPSKNREEAERIARIEYGIQEDYERIAEMAAKANALAEKMNTITGNDDGVSFSESTSYKNKSPFSKRVDELLKEHSGVEERTAIKAAYNRKKQMLWLCETLEEAKAIVGLEVHNEKN